ncbi:MAG: hypothetical protein ABIJ96_07735 [Elusimicrobiota bacterium]
MRKIICPFCDSPRIRRASTRFKHLLRTLLRSEKRYCPACRSRWLETWD